MRRDLRSDFTTRQTMQADLFELYFYSDPEIRPVSMHSHDYYEFYFFLEGNVDLQIEKKKHPLHVGDVIVVPPGVRHHAIRHDKTQEKCPYRRYVFWISRKYLAELSDISPDYRYLAEEAENGNYVHHLEKPLFQEVQAKAIHVLEELHTQHYGHDTFLRLYSSDFLLTLTRYLYESENRTAAAGENERFHQLLDYIDAHISDELSLDGIASAFFVSKSYVVHSFKAQLGLSVHQYIVKKRLSKCRDAMISGENITRTFLTYGFNDYSNFYKAFRREFGCSPKEYRDMHLMK